MSVAKLVAKIPALSGDPKDAVQMTLHAAKAVGGGIAVADAHSLNGAMAHFLADLVSDGTVSTHSLGSLLANDIARSLVTLECYDAEAGGSPVAMDAPPGPLQGAQVADDLPRQASLVLSLRADFGSVGELGAIDTAIPTDARAQAEGAPATHTGRDHPRARRRGRVFIGPLCNYDTTNSPCFAGPHMRTIIANAYWVAFKNALNAIDSPGTWYPAIWSKRDGVARPVTSIVVDNVFDTQRRRVVKSTLRTALP